MLRLRLLGPIGLEHEDGRAVRSVLAQPKRLALLAYLAAVHPPASRRRDALLGLFWPEVEAERARTSLRQALYQLRRSLGAGVLTGKGAELVGVDPGKLWCDAAVFRKAREEGRSEEALDLYRGPFLEGFHLPGAPAFERWMDGERRRARLEASGAAWDLAERAEASGDDAAARRWAERALELTPYDEAAVRRFLGLMAHADQPAAAIRGYERYVGRLAEDLELEPTAETRKLAERIRSGEAGGRPSTPGLEAGGQGTGGAADGPGARGEGALAASRGESLPEAPASRPESVGGRDGDDPASSPGEARSSWRRRLGRLAPGATGVAGMLAVAGAIIAVFVFQQGGPSDDGPAAGARIAGEVVVVFPFRTTGADPALGEGMVDLLTVKLAGTPPFRPVDPRTAVSAWRRLEARGPTGRERLLAAASDLGAGKMVDGSVVRSGSNVVLAASVLDVSGGRTAGRVSVRGERERLLDLVDELAARLLALDAGEGERLASLTSASLRAVRSWVRGRAAFREARYRQAAAHFEEALRRDSTFALAGLGLRQAAEWSSGPSRRQRQLGERLAWEGRASLTVRDRAMLDVLLGPRYPAPSSRAQELEADRRALDLAPDSPEAWYEFGDDLYHRGELMGVDAALGQAADAFARALALDSSFAAPLGHLIESRTLDEDTARVRALTSLYLSRHPESELADFYRWRSATLVGDDDALGVLRGEWESVPVLSLWRILGYAAMDGRGLEDADEVAAHLRHRPGPPAERAITRTMLHAYYLNRGRPGEALAVQRELGRSEGGRAPPAPARPVSVELVHGALYWDGDRSAAAAVVSGLEVAGWSVPPEPERRSDRMRELCLAAQWWASEDDGPPKVERAIRFLRRSSYAGSRMADGERDRRCAALLQVLIADTEHIEETERRVDLLDSLSRTVPTEEFSVRANLASVRALAALGHDTRALAIASRRLPNWNAEYGAPRYLWRARLAERLGEKERAASAAATYRALRGGPHRRGRNDAAR